MQEFICPNGRMSVNGVCPIFEGDDGQIKDFQTPKTFDNQLKEDRKKSGFFKFDFEKETPSAKKTAGNIISENIGAYNSFVENNLGIPSSVQNVARVGSAISGFGSYGIIGAVAPFAIPFVAGAALNNQAQKEQEAAINRESVRDLQGRIDKGDFGSNRPGFTGYGTSIERGAAMHGGGNNSGDHDGGASAGAQSDEAAGMGGY